MFLEFIYNIINDRVKKEIELLKKEARLDDLYNFAKDEVKKLFHLSSSETYAVQFDILPRHTGLQSDSMNPFYIVVNSDATGYMVNKDGEIVYIYDPHTKNDAYIAVSFYRNCGLYTSKSIDSNKVPKKSK